MISFSVGVTLQCDYPGCAVIGSYRGHTQTEAATIARINGWSVSRSGCANEPSSCRCPEHRRQWAKGGK